MDVRTLFLYRLEPGQSKFEIERPINCKGTNTGFSFAYLNLTPDFYSRQATLYNINPKIKEAIKYNAKLTFNYLDSFYEGTEYTLSSQTRKIGDVINSINTHFDVFKPASLNRAPFFIDWTYPGADSTELSEVEFYQASAVLFYNENYNEAKHWNGLPSSTRDIERTNNFLFPTNSDRDLLSHIRLRLWIAPNTTVSFSTDNILLALGMKSLGPRGRHNRFQYQNTSETEYECIEIEEAPKLQIVPGSGQSKIYLSPTTNQIVSENFQLFTTRERDLDNGHLAEDLNKNLVLEAARYNVSFGLGFNEADRTFKFLFPENPGLKIVVRLQAPLVYRLGFGHGERIRKDNVALPMETDANENLSDKAETLVFDTGMTVVTMDQTGNKCTYGVQDEIVSVLTPKIPGILESTPNVTPIVVPTCTETNKLSFSIWRFSEDGTTVPLNWKTGGYLHGVLVGRI